jgi:hypothetical protein
MQIQPIEHAPREEDAREEVRVDVMSVQSGGWNVIASVGRRIVVVKHCADWHRTERTRRLLDHSITADDLVLLH